MSRDRQKLSRNAILKLLEENWLINNATVKSKLYNQYQQHTMKYYLKRQLWITASCYLGQILVGYTMGWTAPVIPKLQDPEQTPLPGQISETETSLIGSIFYVGTIAGPYLSGFLCNIIGRKPCFYLAGLLTLLSFILLGTAYNLAMIYVGRVFIGLGTGMIFIVNIVYIGEIASSNIRGVLLTGTAIFSTLGTLLVYAVGPYVTYPILSYIPAGIAALYIFSIMFIPESPTFLIIKDRQAEANKVMVTLGRSDDSEGIEAVKNNVEEQSVLEDWKQILTIKSNRKALFITLTLGMLQQGSGIIVVIFFATTIFELAGSSIEPSLATIIIGITQIFASTLTPLFVERIGRKVLLLISTAACALSLTTLGFYFYLDFIDHSSIPSIQWLPLVTLIVFFISYDFGFGIIPVTLAGEMFNSKVRSSGSTVTVTLSWLFGFGVISLFGLMVSELGSHVTFWIFAGMCASAFLFSLVFVPETKGKTLDEIQDMLNK